MKPVGQMMTKIMTKTLKKKGLADAGLVKISEHWKEIIDTDFAANTKPLKLKNGVLTLSAPSGMALELQHKSNVLIENVNQILEYQAITRIKFIQ